MLKTKQITDIGIQHPGFISGKYYPMGIGSFTVFSGVGGTALNTIIYSVFYLPKKVSIDRLCINVTGVVTGSFARFGLYTNNNGLPLNLIIDAGEVDCSTTGSKEVIVNLTLDTGWYWLAINVRGALPNLSLISGIGIMTQVIYGSSNVSTGVSIFGYRQSFTYGSLPSIALQSSYSVNSATNPVPWIRIA